MQGIIQSLKKVTSSSTSTEVMRAARSLKKLCAHPKLKTEFIYKVKLECPDIVKEIPDFEKALDSLETIPLERFSNPKEVLIFTEALIESGIAAQVERGLVFVLGNTNTGKTSLVNTFKSYVESPSKEPTSKLTKPNDDLIETQVLELYDNLSLNQQKPFKVSRSTSSAPTLVKLEEAEEAPEKQEGLQLKIVDLGEMKHFSFFLDRYIPHSRRTPGVLYVKFIVLGKHRTLPRLLRQFQP